MRTLQEALAASCLHDNGVRGTLYKPGVSWCRTCGTLMPNGTTLDDAGSAPRIA